MPRSTSPSYRRQRRKNSTDLAFVELGGQRRYLGTYGTPASRERYHALLAEWESNGGQLLPAKEDSPTISTILLAFLRHAEQHYVHEDGSPTSEPHLIRSAMRPLRKLYGSTDAANFGPKALRAVRQVMIDDGLARSTINEHIGRIKRVFRWAVEHELVPPSVLHGLTSVRGLQRGRSKAKDTCPVVPVPEAAIDAVRPHVNRQVWPLIQLQLLTGARPGELLELRPIDIDMSGEVWAYTPKTHKTAYHGHNRTIYLGPKAQQVVKPFLVERPVHRHLFSPAEAEKERRGEQHKQRSTPIGQGNRPGTNRSPQPQRRPRTHYDVNSYRRAIQRACDSAFPPPEKLSRRMVTRAADSKPYRVETDHEWRTRLGVETRTQKGAILRI